MPRNANFKNKRFSFECPVYLLWCLSGFMKNLSFQYENACSQFPPTELVRNLIQIWDWSDEQNTIILRRFKGEACQKNTKKHRCNNKTMNISWGFSLWIEISGKGCVYHNLPWVFNSYVLLKGGEGRAKYHGGRREKKERRIQAHGAKISSPAPQVCDPKGIIKDQLWGGKCLDRPHSEPK